MIVWIELVVRWWCLLAMVSTCVEADGKLVAGTRIGI